MGRITANEYQEYSNKLLSLARPHFTDDEKLQLTMESIAIHIGVDKPFLLRELPVSTANKICNDLGLQEFEHRHARSSAVASHLSKAVGYIHNDTVMMKMHPVDMRGPTTWCLMAK